MMGIDLKPLDRGMDALVRMADALEALVEIGRELIEQNQERDAA